MEAETQASSDFDSETDQSDNEIFYYDAEKEDQEENEKYHQMTAQQNYTRNVEYYRHLMVGQAAATTTTTNKSAASNDSDVPIEKDPEYNFTVFSFINITFGLLDGALNTMPRGGLL